MNYVYLVQTGEPDAQLLAVFPSRPEADVYIADAQKWPEMEDLYVVPVAWKPIIDARMMRDYPRPK